MKIQWGMMMTDGRGKLGGQVASKNRAGAYVRTKVTPSNPQTVSQSVVRSILAVLSKRWSNVLSEAERTAWRESASSGEWDKTNVFGNTQKPSGFNLFVGMNSLQAVTRGAGLSMPPKKATFLIGQSLAVTAVAGSPDTVEAVFEAQAGTPEPDTVIQVQATAPVSAGKSYVKNLFRDIYYQPLTSGTNTIIMGSAYTDKFGELAGSEGKQIYVRVRQVVAGQATPWISAVGVIS